MEISIKINGQEKEVHIPENWSEVKLGHYMDLTKINKKEFNTQLERDIAVMAAFLGISEEELELLDLDVYNQMIEGIQFLLTPPKDLPIKDHIKINGEDWWIKKDFDKLTVGERISIDTILMNGGVEENFDKMLTLFLKKRDENGELETYRTSHMNRVELFRKEVNFMDVKNIMLFFSTGISLSESPTKESSVKKRIVKEKKSNKKDLEKQ
jgi:hypothetical protein